MLCVHRCNVDYDLSSKETDTHGYYHMLIAVVELFLSLSLTWFVSFFFDLCRKFTCISGGTSEMILGS
jgi:hypothetical protein